MYSFLSSQKSRSFLSSYCSCQRRHGAAICYTPVVIGSVLMKFKYGKSYFILLDLLMKNGHQMLIKTIKYKLYKLQNITSLNIFDVVSHEKQLVTLQKPNDNSRMALRPQTWHHF